MRSKTASDGSSGDAGTHFHASDHDGIADFMNSAWKAAKDLWKSQTAYFRLSLYRTLGRIMGKVLVMLLVAVLGLFTVVFLSIALALWLGQLWQSLTLGFLAISGLWLILTLCLGVFLGKAIRNKVVLRVVNSLYRS